MRILSIEITPELSGKSVREVLRGSLKVSAGAITRARKRERGITLDGTRVFTNETVRQGGVLSIEIAEKEDAAHFAPVSLPLAILYEDEDLLIVNKEPSMPVYAAKSGGGAPALANILAAYLGEGAVLHFVSRLDRGTSGILVVAKNAYAHERLRLSQHTGDFCREYRAIAAGELPEDRGEIELPIARGAGVRRVIDESGKPAKTRYEVLARREGLSLLRLQPETGRTHQLRVHLSAIGYPLLGDWLYGSETPEITRPALHSARLTLRHPVSGERLSVSCPLPADMKRFFPGEET